MKFSSGDLLRIGVDIGGTFTDFVIFNHETGSIHTFKTLSTPNNPALAVIEGLKQLHVPTDASIVHGSTVATNALLERKGARTALITTKGFGDLLLIGRQNRPSLYDWDLPHPQPLIPSELAFEITERVDCRGSVLIPLDEAELVSLVDTLIENRIQSVAVSLIFSFLHPQHEQVIASRLRAHNLFVSVSSEIIPEFREYERTSTTAVNAYVSPIIDHYLSALSSSLPDVQLQIMQSNGGMINLEEAKRNGVRCILSGPAGGVVGANYLFETSRSDEQNAGIGSQDIKLITFDMGGTSTDVSLIDQNLTLTNESSIGGCPINIPILDIHTIGAGGGSIAYIDKGGALCVGPQSAGAEPGPACYGRGDLPTVTDANLVLGRLVPEFFMGGELHLDPDRSWETVQRLGDQLGIDVIQCALGIILVTNAHMERALRIISVERGFDPREFSLFAFGGAGGLHAVELARGMSIPRVFISPYASVLSAFGMLAADIIKDYVQTVMLDDSCSMCQISSYYEPLCRQATADILSQDIDPNNIIIQRYLDARYEGQSYELTIPYGMHWESTFHQSHLKTFGYQSPDSKIQLVNIRVRAIGKTSKPLPHISHSESRHANNQGSALIGYRDVIFPTHSQSIPFFHHEALTSGSIIKGPAVIVRPDTTVLIGERDALHVDDYQNLWIDVG